MPTKNIFAGFGVRSEFVNLIYTELTNREFVSYADILALYCGRPKGYYEKMACNSEPGYGELKKAFPDVLKTLREYDPTWKVLRTKTGYQHGLLLTKPLHHSQQETLPFGEHDGQWYGEVRLTIEPNRELRGRILLYGENLEVVSPQTLREQIKETLKKQITNYDPK